MGDRLVQPAWRAPWNPAASTAAEYWRLRRARARQAASATQWYATLYYQSTSKVYIEFLRDEIRGSSDTLSSPTMSGEPSAYIAQTDPFFSGLKGWGDAIWDLWLHNGGAAPVKMTEAGTAARQGMMSAVTSSSQILIRKRSWWSRAALNAGRGATGYQIDRLDDATWTP
jgi:hypothetical protein